MCNGCSIEPGAALRGGGDWECVEHEGEAKCEQEWEWEWDQEWDHIEHGGEAKCEQWSLWQTLGGESIMNLGVRKKVSICMEAVPTVVLYLLGESTYYSKNGQ